MTLLKNFLNLGNPGLLHESGIWRLVQPSISSVQYDYYYLLNGDLR